MQLQESPIQNYKSIRVAAFIWLICSTFVFSPDAPKDQLWRKTYKKCFLECVAEGVSKHACNLHCVHKADRKVAKERSVTRRSK